MTGGQASAVTADWATYPPPTTLGGTSVAIEVGGTTEAAFIYYVWPSWQSEYKQIDAVMPSIMPT